MQPASAATGMAVRDDCPGCWGNSNSSPCGNNKEEAVAVAIDFAASLNFEGNGNGNNDKDNAGDKEAEEVDKGEEEGWRRLSRKSKSRTSNDELHNYFHAQLMGGSNAPIKVATALQFWTMRMSVLPS
jgi:hypothetical protein